MSKSDKDIFLRVLKSVKVPDGYASNISRCVHLKDRTIRGLKSHDNHILMQQLLPIAARRALPKNVVQALIEFSNFFRMIFSKALNNKDLDYIKDRIALILCQLEKIFPPSFFDIMEHLPIHLVDEALAGGAIQYRWMYPIERFLHTLKKYVRNRAHPEGSIAKGYVLEECMTFFERYMADHVETKSNRPARNYDGKDHQGCPFGKEYTYILETPEWEQAHRYVLANVDEVEPYREKHLAILKRMMPRAQDRQLYKAHDEQFPSWFADYVQRLQTTNDGHQLSSYVMKLAAGPTNMGTRYNGYCINGFRFRTNGSNKSRVTHNSGVTLNSMLRSYASSKDNNPSSGDVSFYGELTNIIEIRYSHDLKFVLFKCDWVDINKGIKVDEFKFTLVNFNHLLYKDNKVTDEPFIFASQASQVIYIKDPTDPGWSVVLKMASKEYCDDTECLDDSLHSSSLIQQIQPFEKQALDESRVIQEEDANWLRGNTNYGSEDDDDDAYINE